jgi:hypothetical protein
MINLYREMIFVIKGVMCAHAQCRLHQACMPLEFLWAHTYHAHVTEVNCMESWVYGIEICCILYAAIPVWGFTYPLSSQSWHGWRLLGPFGRGQQPRVTRDEGERCGTYPIQRRQGACGQPRRRRGGLPANTRAKDLTISWKLASRRGAGKGEELN